MTPSLDLNHLQQSLTPLVSTASNVPAAADSAPASPASSAPIPSRANSAAVAPIRAASTRHADIIVIGGGPAGSTAAGLLAEQGYQVVLFEKTRFPRFHIGESLLPANVPLLKSLGVDQEVAAIAMPKYGVEFVSPWHDHHTQLEFAESWDKSLVMAYQVRRADFDDILLRRAVRVGADVRQEHRVSGLEFLPDNQGATLQVQGPDGEREQWTSRFVIDASGRDTLVANKLKCKQKNDKHNSSALYAHLQGVERLPGKAEGNITIFWFAHGWFWMIPLTDGVTSIGAVCWPYYLKSRKTDLTQFFHDTVALCPGLAERLRSAELVGDVHATGNYSYSCDRSYGANYLLLGDAYAFVDPVFSSGVYLAMNSAVVGAQTVNACLREPKRAASALARFDKVMRKGPREFSWFIYRVTNPTMRDLFMYPRNLLRVKEALLSMLAGDIFGKTPIWPSLYVFKGMYWTTSVLNLKRTVMAMRQRKRNIQDVDTVASN